MAADVLSLLSQVPATKGRLARGRLLGRAVGQFRELSPDQQRELAVSVAQRFAPALIDQLPDEGPLDMDQIKALVQSISETDPDELLDLAARLADPEELGTLISAPTPPPVASTDMEEPEPPDTDDQSEPAEPEPSGEDQSGPVDAPAEDPGTGDTVARHDDPSTGDTGASAAAPGPLSPVPDPLPRPGSPGGRWGDDDAPEEPDPEEPTGLVARVRSAPTASARLAAVRRIGSLAWNLTPAERHELVEAVPDGWQRRRVVADLVRRDLVPFEEIADLVRLLGTPRDRGWLARTLHADGTLDDADLLAVAP